jgi:hypothetical protein
MEEPTLNEVRHSLDGIGDVVHELPPLPAVTGFIHRASRVTI